MSEVQNQTLDAADVLYPQPEEIQDTAPEEAPSEPEQPQIEAAQLEQPETEQSDQEPTEETAEATPAEPEEPVVEDEGDTIASFSELISHQEWDPEWANSLNVDIKVDGEIKQVPLSELVASHQTMEAAQNRLDEGKQILAQANESANKIAEQSNEHLAASVALTQLADKLFEIDAAEANLAELRESDPTQYMLKKEELQARRVAIDNVKREAAKLLQTQTAELAGGEQSVEQIQAYQTEQQKLLIDRIPEWKEDSKLAETQAGEMITYLTGSYEFTEDQINQPWDHRLFDMARKAMLWDRQQQRQEAATKKVVKIPKRLPPGPPAPEKEGPKDAAEILYPNS